jgi:hypothetical protein
VGLNPETEEELKIEAVLAGVNHLSVRQIVKVLEKCYPAERFRRDAGPTVVEAVETDDEVTSEGKINVVSNAAQKVIRRNEVIVNEG